MARLIEKSPIKLEEVPSEVNRYWTRIVISDEERGKIPRGNGWNYISPAVCGSLTIDAGTFDLPPSFDEGKKVHSHGNEEFNYVLEGEGWIRVEDEIHHFQAGDFIFIPAFARHAWGNDGENQLRILFYRPIKPTPSSAEIPMDVRLFEIKPRNDQED